MDIHEEFKRFTDQYGLLSDKSKGGKGVVSGNGILYTAHYVLALTDNRKLTIEDGEQIGNALNLVEKESGLYMRSVEKPNDVEGPDDYVGIGTLSEFLFHPDRAARVLKRLRMTGGSLNTTTPGKWTPRTWLGRQQQLVCHLQFAAGEKPDPFKLLIWCISVLSSMLSKHEDSYILSYHLVRVGEKHSFIAMIVGQIFRLQKRTIKSVLEAHFGPGQPFSLWMK